MSATTTTTTEENRSDGGATLSAAFDKVYAEYRNLVNYDESTNATVYQVKVSECIRKLEELTRSVSAVDMFTKNEHYEGLPPGELKFLLLPYLLGNLWMLRLGEERATTLIVSQTYFLDFLERCTDYEFMERKGDDDDSEEKEKSSQGKKNAVLSPAERRENKIKKLRKNQELDKKIEACRERLEITSEECDDFVLRELFVSLIHRSINDAEDQLESIAMELGLIRFGSTISAEGGRGDESAGTSVGRPSLPREKSKPLKPFIITKDATQKQVFGVGYPSLPVMTVEELYEQRRAQGQWAPPPANGGGFQNPEVNQEEAEAVAKERLEEGDDEENLARQRAMDEYKEDHRRGWGNRFNRS